MAVSAPARCSRRYVSTALRLSPSWPPWRRFERGSANAIVGPSAPRVPRMGPAPLRVLAFRGPTIFAPSLAYSRQSVVLRRLAPAYLTKRHRRVLPRAAPATAGGHDEFWRRPLRVLRIEPRLAQAIP